MSICFMKINQPLITLKALGDDTRLNIISFLMNGEKCVCEIFPCVKRTQSTVSIQLNILERAGVISSRRDGKWVYYKIANKHVLNLLKVLKIKPKGKMIR